MAILLTKTLTKAGIAKSFRVLPLAPLLGPPSDVLFPTPSPPSEGPSLLPGYLFSEPIMCACFCIQSSVASVCKALPLFSAWGVSLRRSSARG